MRKILFALASLLVIGIANAPARADLTEQGDPNYCGLAGDPSQGFNVVFFDPYWIDPYTAPSGTWTYQGPFDCNTCIGNVAWWNQNTGAQASCHSIADEENGGGWYCYAPDGYFSGSIEPNSNSARAAFLLSLGTDPRYQPPSNWECYGNVGQYLADPP